MTTVLPHRPPDTAISVAAVAAGTDDGWRPSTSSAWLAGTFILLVAALGFLLASFPARNSDIWLHLARGRQVTQGQFNQGWLYDLLCYGLYTAFGGTGLAIFKAALTGAMALLLFRLSQSAGKDVWIPAFCTALAVLAMGIRLLLQPAIVSDFLFVLLLYGIYERGETPRTAAQTLLRSWPLFILFIVWANVDDWFVLGLASAGLIWLGQVLDLWRSDRRSASELAGQFLVRWIALAAMCVLNPGHVLVFKWPAELSWLPYQTLLANLGWSAANLAYVPLLLLSLLSFVICRATWKWQRFLPWIGLATLSALDARATPFFAVLAGPVLAWNLQDLVATNLSARQVPSPAWQRAFALGRCLTAVSVVVLVVCAWPGWLQSGPVFEPRRWAVDPAPTLETGAKATRRWIDEGKLGPKPVGLHLSPESANVFAWFCPEAKGLNDAELADAVRGESKTTRDAASQLREPGINYVILYDPIPERFIASMARFLDNPGQWPLLYVEGYLAVFGWRDPATAGGADPFRDWQWDANELAFRPAEHKKAPARPGIRAPEPREWYEAFWKPAPRRPADQDEATQHLMHAGVLQLKAPEKHKAAWQLTQAASIVASASGWSGPAGMVDARMHLARLSSRVLEMERPQAPERIALAMRVQFIEERDDTSPALLYLAIRAARRTLANHPDNAQAYLVLGESYMRLLHNTRERAWAKRMPEIAQLRQAQASAAFNNAVRLRPNLAQAHYNLMQLYAQLDYLDLMLQHYQTYRQLARGARVASQADPTLDEQQEQEVSMLAKEVQKRENTYEVATSKFQVAQRASVALKQGLAGKARDLLLDSHISAFGEMGMAMELELLLRTGQPDKVWEWSSPEQRSTLGPAYYWLRIAALGALGEYELARHEFKEFASAVAVGPQGEPVPSRDIISMLVAKRVLDESTPSQTVGDLFVRAMQRRDFVQRTTELAENLKHEADLLVLGGLLALEAGDSVRAESGFREALSYWQDESAAASGGGIDFAGRVVAQDCLNWLR